MWVATVLGPLTTARATHLHERYAELLRRLDTTHWLRAYPGDFAQDLEDREDVLAHALELMRQPWSGHPLRAFVSDGHVALLHSHGLGDAVTSRRLVADLLAAKGAPFTLPRLRRVGPIELAGAAARCWGRRPSTLLPALCGLRARAVPEGEPEREAVTDTHPVLVGRTLGPSAQERLRQHLDRRHPGSTMSMALLSEFIDALSYYGVRPNRVSLAADIRRYLRNRNGRGGNLVAVLQLPVQRSTEVEPRVRAAVDSGQLLAQYGLSYVRNEVLTRLRCDIANRGMHPAPTIGWSDRRRVDEWDELPWHEGARTIVGGLAPPAGARINVHLSQVGDDLYLLAVVNRAAFDPCLVEAALDHILGSSGESTGSLHASAARIIEQDAPREGRGRFVAGQSA